MHLFLYQAARHTAPSSPYARSNRQRYVQGTIRGDFDLELLKRGIKGRFKILPHGEHPFQIALKEIELQEEFYGHIVQIEEARNAVWFKLNYDQVGRHVTRYVGGWRDLDPAAIEADITEYKMLKTQHRSHTTLMSSVRQHTYACNNFYTRTNATNPILDHVAKATLDLHHELGQVTNQLELENARLLNAMITVQDRVRAYLREHKL